MNRTWILIIGFLVLAGLTAFVLWAGRREKKTGLDWKSYPGFRFPPKKEENDAWFSTEPKGEKSALLGMLSWAFLLLAAALELAVMNTVLAVAPLRLCMKLLPLAMLVLQEAEILSGLVCLRRSKSNAFFLTVGWMKWILLILWLLGFFASLLIKGFQL